MVGLRPPVSTYCLPCSLAPSLPLVPRTLVLYYYTLEVQWFVHTAGYCILSYLFFFFFFFYSLFFFGLAHGPLPQGFASFCSGPAGATQTHNKIL